MFLPVIIILGSRLFFSFKDRYERSRRAVLRKETWKMRKQKILDLFDSYRQGDKRACLDDQEIIFYDDLGGGNMSDFFREEGIDFVSFCDWLEESVGRATIGKGVELLKNPKIVTHPNAVGFYLREIRAVCEAFNLQLGEFGLTEVELGELARMNIVAWRDGQFEKYQNNLKSLNNSWQEIVDVLNAQEPPIPLPPSALMSKDYCPQFPSQREGK